MGCIVEVLVGLCGLKIPAIPSCAGLDTVLSRVSRAARWDEGQVTLQLQQRVTSTPIAGTNSKLILVLQGRLVVYNRSNVFEPGRLISL
jgi:ABC-type enterochelin transport system ATPase subunit